MAHSTTAAERVSSKILTTRDKYSIPISLQSHALSTQYPSLHKGKRWEAKKRDRKETQWRFEQRVLAKPGALISGVKKDHKEVKSLLDQLSGNTGGSINLAQEGARLIRVIAVCAAARRSLIAKLSRGWVLLREQERFLALLLILLAGFLYDHSRHRYELSTMALQIGSHRTLQYELVPSIKRFGGLGHFSLHLDTVDV